MPTGDDTVCIASVTLYAPAVMSGVGVIHAPGVPPPLRP